MFTQTAYTNSRLEVTEMANISVRVEDDVKKDAESILSQLGLSLSTATNVFLRQVILHNGLPFAVELEQPNAETIAAMKETEKMLHDPNAKSFSSVEDFMKDLES